MLPRAIISAYTPPMQKILNKIKYFNINYVNAHIIISPEHGICVLLVPGLKRAGHPRKKKGPRAAAHNKIYQY